MLETAKAVHARPIPISTRIWNTCCRYQPEQFPELFVTRRMTSWRGDLVHEGHIDHMRAKSIKLALPPMTAFQIETINTARITLQNLGRSRRDSGRPCGVYNLKNYRVRQTYKKACWCGGWKISGEDAGEGFVAAQHDEFRYSRVTRLGRRTGRKKIK